MSNISSFFDTRRVSGVVVATLLSLLLVAFTTYGVTTISTNVDTAGTLNVESATTLNGNVTLGNAIGDAITITGNATSSNTFNVAGNLFVNGRATTSGATGNIATEGSLTVNGAVTLGDAIGDNITITGNATSSNTFNVAGNLFVNGRATTSGATGNIATEGSLTVNGAVTLGNAAVDAITITGNASTTNSLTVGGTASTTKLVVGGNSINGTFAGIVFGTCNLTAASVTASTTANFNCTSATGVRTSDTIFVNATSSLVSGGFNNQIQIRAASSSVDGRINVDITNLGTEAITQVVSGTLQFWAAR